MYLHKNIQSDGIYIIEDLHCGLSEKTNSVLYYLLFNERLSFMTMDECNTLNSIIDNVTVYSRNNNKSNFNKKSITSVIKFK